jgi:two-component system, sensor histidine kinase and response regulator
MDGLEATAAIREWEKDNGSHVPIIAMTALAMSGDSERCLQAGMDAYISKPIKAEEVLRTIEEIIASPEYSQATKRDRQECRDARMDWTISKPFKITELMKATAETAGNGAEPAESLPETQPEPRAAKVLDPQGALAQCEGDTEMLGSVVSLFFREIPKHIEALVKDIETGDCDSAARSAHAVRGMLSNFAAEAGVQAAFALEQAARAGDSRGAREAFAVLEKAIEELKPELASLVR